MDVHQGLQCWASGTPHTVDCKIFVPYCSIHCTCIIHISCMHKKYMCSTCVLHTYMYLHKQRKETSATNDTHKTMHIYCPTTKLYNCTKKHMYVDWLDSIMYSTQATSGVRGVQQSLRLPIHPCCTVHENMWLLVHPITLFASANKCKCTHMHLCICKYNSHCMDIVVLWQSHLYIHVHACVIVPAPLCVCINM